MRETGITIAAGDVTLAGTLALPEGSPRGAVLFLHGSGPLDRNENIRGQRLDVFNTLAADLASVGFASLRYDKRGCGASTGSYHDAGQSDFLADAGAALDTLKAARPFPYVFALGHSEGTLTAARLSLAAPVDGLVLLAPFVKPLREILMTQAGEAEKAIRLMPGLGGWLTRMLIRLTGPPAKHQEKLLARIAGGTETSFRYLGRRIDAKSLRELLAIDPAAIYREVTVPMLVLGGGKDLQCDPADVGTIAAIAGELATPVLIDDLTHLLRKDSEPASLNAYGRLLKEPLDAEMLGIVRDWLLART